MNKKELRQLAIRIAREEGVPVALFLGLIQQESGWNPEAGSSAGARGLTQLMPGTARGLGVKNITNPVENLRGGARYLKQQLDRFGTPQLALSAYNSGPGGSESQGRVEGFSETQAYVERVMALEEQYRGMEAETEPMFTTGASAPAAQPAAPQPAMDMRPVSRSLGTESSTKALQQGLGSAIARVAGGGGEIPQSRIAPPQQPKPYTDPSTPTPPETGTTAGEPFGPDAPPVGGMNAEFLRRFKQLQAAVAKSGGSLTIYSGARDPAHQAKLYQAALVKYGSEQEARRWVAPPGKSNHDPSAGLKHGFGAGAIASDLRGDLAMAHKLAPQFGLHFPLSNEAWHIELAGSRGK